MDELKLIKRDNKASFSIDYKQTRTIGLISIILYILYNIFISDIYEYFGENINRQIFLSWAYILLTLVIIILWSRSLKLSFVHFKVNFKKKIKYILITGVIVILAQVALTIIFVMLFKLESITNQTQVENSIENAYYLSMMTTILFGPIIEEIIFRGVIFRFLREKTYVISYLLSSFIFAFIHFYEAILFDGDFLQLIFIIPFMIVGLGFCKIYEKTDNLLSPIFLHMIINAIAFAASV